jgi:hypothetical protein
MKICKKCNEPKGLFDFYAHRTTKDRLSTFCKSCDIAKTKMWQERNPNYQRSRNYGLSQEGYDAMLSKQANRCAICENEMKTPNVDHDHKTKAVRGLLCWHCNVGLGHFFDNRQLLERAMGYLQAHGN